MLGTFDDSPGRRLRRTDAEVFAERVAAAERGEEYDGEYETFALGMPRPPMPGTGVN